ncbi:threonine aldolase family protein [Segatella albensis]|jgi:threonine aldolase|uniref:threonine aldolase family protein n=1 Tax=Segatella albensis TaxID=77768 RepID=UPI0003FC2901|nr:aminotransferase class I/II-fold pyridoxal phosphate-dependent enzyme [Segatella albensis]
MISFESDYNNGVEPAILRRLIETNNDKTSGYGFDPYCEQAKAKIKRACELEEADIFFLVGGTQTNSTVIDSLLCNYEGVICVDTGHINVHEAGAIEAFSHKVIALPSADGKLKADQLEKYMAAFTVDESSRHMVQPGMVYITFPTELGGLYTKQEIADIYDVCRKYSLYLYIDGARLGYALASDKCDVTLPFLAKHCDVFYIGGTKVGAMFGEAVVYTNTRAPKRLFTIVKNHGALLAKGRMLGIQFDTLFSDDLYFRISRHAMQMAMKLKAVFEHHGFRMGIDSPTNQQFVILSPEQKKILMQKIAFEVWEPINENEILCRFVTSWATTEEDIKALDEALSNI